MLRNIATVKKLLEPSSPEYGSRKRAIHEWAESERPREKFMTEGGSKLSPAELLAILVGSGTPQEDAVTLMNRILTDCNGSLRTLGRRSIEELCAYHGVGLAKAITILAACELGVRHESEAYDPQRFTSSNDIYRFFYPKLRGCPHEEVHALYLNQKLGFIRSVLIGRGGIDGAMVDVRLVLREALVCDAVHVALCHNHPSGDPHPSLSDDKITQQLKRACEAVNLKFIDHIVLADSRYFSYVDESRL